MSLFKPKYKLRHEGDQLLRDELDQVQDQLQRLQKAATQGLEDPIQFVDSIKIQQAKFNLLYHEARYRGTKAKTLRTVVTR
ncbi:YaaL family protein [Lapidilactobacillus luobeiensis]|uniref:YaaL family protein n=1 Tax=Lapidilactobacillus luobeiensis TaxID=2950371 RepID=UPI0021C411CD|nr:YaaL family protein [Lapidilactobacillus luobeiensis]